MEDREFILNRLKSKPMSIDEFNYESLTAPPISSMFSQFDIYQLNQIARSIKYAAKPEVKYQEIDKIMRSRGFVKLTAGTNRVVYRPVENNTFVVKVAYDAVGLGDNPKEFRNQMLFKPFVTKVFEVTPCGTLGVFERVVPIQSREEFLTIAADVYEMITNWFIGEYIMEDIGTKFFMNVGVRRGFGPVLLDFPYVYKLDGNKLFCNAPSNNTASGCCEGIIDYDPGFNFLYCTKCGVKYKAKELAEAISNQKVIVKSEGETKMKLTLKGGSKNVNKNIETGEYAGLAKSTPVINKKKPQNNFHMIEEKKENKPKSVVIPCKIEKPNLKEETFNIKNASEVKAIENDNTILDAVKNSEKESIKVTDEIKEKVSPIVFDDSIKDSGIDPGYADIAAGEIETKKDSTVDVKADAYNTEFIFDEIKKFIKDKNERDKYLEFFFEEFKSEIEKITKIKVEEAYNDYIKKQNEYSVNNFVSAIVKAGNIFDMGKEIEDEEAVIDSSNVDLCDKLDDELSLEFKKFLTKYIFTTTYDIACMCNSIYHDKDSDKINIEFTPYVYNKYGDDEFEDVNAMVEDIYCSETPFELSVTREDLSEALHDMGCYIESYESVNEEGESDSNPVEEEVNDPNERYGGITYYAGEVVNAADIFSDEKSRKIVVAIDENGNYLTEKNNNNIVAIRNIDGRDIDNISIVSSQWLSSRIGTNDDVEDDEEAEEVFKEASESTGVFSPNVDVSVNGVPYNNIEDEDEETRTVYSDGDI